MATTTCPNCGKPIRPGARFCGSCGTAIPDHLHEARPAQAPEPQMETCPHCGKQVRVGAKFCTHCGKEIVRGAAQTSALFEKPGPVKPIPPAPARAPEIKAPAAKVPPAPATARRRNAWSLLIIGLALVCLVGAATAYLVMKDPFRWQKTVFRFAAATTPSPPPTASLTSVPLTPTVTKPAASTLAPTDTIPPTEAATPLLATTGTPVSLTGSMTPTITAALSVQLTPTLASSSSPSSRNILLEDDFNTIQNWVAWGKPRATIQNGPGDRWLDLKAAEKPDQAGVTSRLEFPNAPDMQIEFEAQLNSIFVQSPLFIDWDPVQFNRSLGNLPTNTLRLQVRKNLVILQTVTAKNGCEIDIDGTVKHIYKLSMTADKMVELYLDDDTEPRCRMEFSIDPINGRITFTGNGWVTRLLVTETNSR